MDLSQNQVNTSQSDNFIIGKIHVDGIDTTVQIINSYENYIQENSKKDTIINEYNCNKNEIENSIEIEIIIGEEKEKIEFSYYHTFKKGGDYTIKYIFKNNPTKINHMFSDCSL